MTGQIVRVVDLDIKAGVSSDEGDGDDWPELRRKILGADIIILGTPIWLGQPSSVAKRVLERMDAFLETDDRGRMPPFGRLPSRPWSAMKTGHHCHAELYQALNDVGFTIPAGAAPIGSERRWARWTTRTSRNPTTKPHRRPCWRSTPRIWRSF